MTTTKKNSLIAVAIGSLLVTLSCNDNSSLQAPHQLTTTQQLNSAAKNVRVSNYSFNGTEGDPIVLDSAGRWVLNYKAKNQGLKAHFFSHKTIETILGKRSCVGIRFYYGTDDSGNPNLLALGADGSGNDIYSVFETKGQLSSVDLGAKTSSMSFSGTESDSVSLEISRQWIDNYIFFNPSAIQAHFFGYEIIKQILSESGCVGIRCYYALNGSGVQQLLLVGVTSSGMNLLPTSSTSGRVADSGNTIADVSFPCPTHCSGT